jgi:hypothetical protein
MNIEQIIAGVAYFERLFALSGIGEYDSNSTPRHRRIINCPITNRRFRNVAAVRSLCLPFIVAVRNTLLARSWDILSLDTSDDLMRRFMNLVNFSRLEEINGSLPTATIAANWLYGHQIIEGLQQRSNNAVSTDVNLPVVREYPGVNVSQTISATEMSALLSGYTNWQLSVLMGQNEGEYHFNLVSTQAQSDFAYVNQQQLQCATLSILLTRLSVVRQALRALNSPLANIQHQQNPPHSQNFENNTENQNNHTNQTPNIEDEVDIDVEFEMEGETTSAENSESYLNDLLWNSYEHAVEFGSVNQVEPSNETVDGEEDASQPLIFSQGSSRPGTPYPSPPSTPLETPPPLFRRSYAQVVQYSTASYGEIDEEKEPVSVENQEMIIAPIERREILLSEANHFIYQGQARITNLPLVGAYLNTLALPSIPIIQPYNPNSNARADVISGSFVPHGNIRISVAVQIPQAVAHLPYGVLERLAEQGIERERLDVFISIQDNPWENNAERLLRVHPYIHPFGGDGSEGQFQNTVQVSIADVGRSFLPFSQYSVQTHDGVFSPQNMQIMGELDFQKTQVLYSLCTNPRTNRAGLTLHVLLSDLNQRLVLDILEDQHLNSIQEFISRTEIANAITEEHDQFPAMELQYLTGMQARPPLENNVLLESSRQLAVEVHVDLSSAISLPSEQPLSEQFSGQHSAGGMNHELEEATNRAGLNFVQTVLGPEFVNSLDVSATHYLHMLIQNFSDYLRESLATNLREKAAFLGELDPENYNNIESPNVYFHPYAVTTRAILHNSRIRRSYGDGILLREIAAIWHSIRNLPAEQRKNYVDNFSIQMHEIQRAYNIARFYQVFFGSDERTPEDWVDTQNRQIFYIGRAIDEWDRVEENIEKVRSKFIERPIRPRPDESIPDEHLNKDQVDLRKAHRDADRREAQFNEVRHFISNSEAENNQSTITITPEMAGVTIETQTTESGEERRIVRRTGNSLLANFIKIIEIMNRFDYPTSALATDNFCADADSCGPGAETRLLDFANTAPTIRVINISPLQATQLFKELIVPRLPQWTEEAIMAQYDAPEFIRPMLNNPELSADEQIILSPLFAPLMNKIYHALSEMAQNSPEIKFSLTVKDKTGSLVLDEVAKVLLDGFNIHDMSHLVDMQQKEEKEYKEIEEQQRIAQQGGYFLLHDQFEDIPFEQAAPAGEQETAAEPETAVEVELNSESSEQSSPALRNRP